ncbi:MAG: L-threonylcarbamoyladenylate synthase [Thalassobaculaceae bacterium]
MITDASMQEKIATAAIKLREGELAAFPTETVYGLGADATNDSAVAKIFAIKGRPEFNPLITHVRSLEEAQHYGIFSKSALAIAKRFWPGPLTLILNRKRDCPISWLTTAGLSTVALRVSDHPIANELIRITGRPIAAPSANKSGRISPTRAEDVMHEFQNELEIILDGGDCRVGLESTVLDVSGANPAILRPGSITKIDIENDFAPIILTSKMAKITAPGMLESHYAPNCKVRLNASCIQTGEVFLGFGKNALAGSKNLSETGELNEAAANLFRMLRDIDQNNIAGIAVAPIPEHGLGIAINDRLKRAAAPR